MNSNNFRRKNKNKLVIMKQNYASFADKSKLLVR